MTNNRFSFSSTCFSSFHEIQNRTNGSTVKRQLCGAVYP